MNKENKSFKVKVEENSKQAILCHSIYGPKFGVTDFYISSNSNKNHNSYSNFGCSYKHPDYQYNTTEANSILAGSKNFQTVEIEIFAKIN